MTSGREGKAAERGVSVEEAIEQIGYGRFQRKLLAVCGVTWAADAAEVLLIAFALPAIRQEFDLTAAQAGLVATTTFVGMLAGAWFWGTISDRIGRRRGFVLTVLIFATFGLLSALAPNLGWLLVLRALTGFGLGGALPLDFSLFAEYLPAKDRGRRLVLLESFWALGTLLAALLAFLLVPTLGWRALLATSAGAALLVLWIRLGVPESPRYLVAAGRHAEAAAVLARVAATNGRPLPPLALEAPAPATERGVRALFAPALLRPTLVLWGAWFGIALAYYGLFSWLPSIFVERGFSFVRTYEYALLLAVAQLPGYLSAAWLVERVGRRTVLVTYLLGAGASTFLFALASAPAPILAGAILTSFFALGAWAALYAYTPELYPTAIRTTGMGAASGMARVAGALAPVLGGLLVPISLPAALALYAAAFVLAGVLVLALGVETRGRPLPERLAALPARA